MQVVARPGPADGLLQRASRCATTPDAQACDLDAYARLVPRRCSRAASTRRRRSSRPGSPRSRTTPSSVERTLEAARAAFAERDERAPPRERGSPTPARRRPRSGGAARRWRRVDGGRRPARASGARRGRRARGPRPTASDYELLVEAIREGYLLHYGDAAGRPDAGPRPALLAGDRLYALGLARLAELGDLRRGRRARRRDLAVRAGPRGRRRRARRGRVGGRRGRGGLGRDARARAGQGPLRAGDPGAAAALRAAARTLARAGARPLKPMAPGFVTPASMLTIGSAPLHCVRHATCPMAERSQAQKSKYTADRGIPGAFEGETVTRRRFMARTAHTARAIVAAAPSRCPRSASRSGPSSRSKATAGRTSARSTTSTTTTTSRRSSASSAAIGEAGKTTVYVRKRNPKIDTEPADQYNQLHRDLHALRAPRLPGALRGGRRALHLPVPRRRLRLRGAGASAARRCARSTASTRACATASVEVGPRFSVNSELERFSPRDPGEPLDGIGQYLYPSRPSRPASSPKTADAETPKLPAPRRAAAARRRARRDRRTARQPTPLRAGRRGRASSVVDWVDERTSLSGAGALAAVPQGPEGDQLVLHAGLGDDVRLPLAGGHRRVPGDVLRPRRATRAYESVRYITNEVFLGEFVRGMHKWGSTVMVILVFLHMGADVLLRRLQVPARAELGDRRRAADPDDDDVVHGLPAAVRPALLLGDDRRREHQRHRPAGRPLPLRLPARRARSSARRRCRASTRSTCCSCPGLIAALIGAHLYLVAKLGTTAPPWLKAEQTPELREARRASA